MAHSSGIKQVVGELEIDKLVNTLRTITEHTTSISESSVHHPPVYAGKGHDEYVREYVIPLRKFSGKLVQDVTVQKTVNPGLEHTPNRTIEEKVGEKLSKTIELTDGLRITITQREDTPNEATVEVSCDRYRPALHQGHEVFNLQRRFERLNFRSGAGQSTDFLTKVVALLENIDK